MCRWINLNIRLVMFMLLLVTAGVTFAGQTIYVDATNGDDGNDGLTPGTAFATIQMGINTTLNGDTVIVFPGQYLEVEEFNDDYIDFLGKNITLTSLDPNDPNIVANTIISGNVEFEGTEDANCVLRGFTINDPYSGTIYGNGTGATISHCVISGNRPDYAIAIMDCDGTISNCVITDNTNCAGCGLLLPVVFECSGLIKNCTIANNTSGIEISGGEMMTMENCIVYNNGGSQIEVLSGSTLNISYSNLQNGLGAIAGSGTVNWGLGNIDEYPYFADAANKDYHLMSQGWRWSEYLIHDSHWTYDFVTSRCIDAGNPGSPLGDELLTIPDDPNHDWGENLRVNMGAYGGTAEASIPPYDWALLGDLTNDGTVGWEDLEGQAGDWLTTANQQPGDLNRDGVVDMIDYAMLAEDWLQMTDWAQ